MSRSTLPARIAHLLLCALGRTLTALLGLVLLGAGLSTVGLVVMMGARWLRDGRTLGGAPFEGLMGMVEIIDVGLLASMAAVLILGAHSSLGYAIRGTRPPSLHPVALRVFGAFVLALFGFFVLFFAQAGQLVAALVLALITAGVARLFYRRSA